jgi:hypothetical protein
LASVRAGKALVRAFSETPECRTLSLPLKYANQRRT